MEALETEVNYAPLVRFVNKILLDAIHSGASDIHFEPYEHHYRIRFRQDGILREIKKEAQHSASRLAARLKVMSKLDISEKRLPQDGRFKLAISANHSIDFRISTCPTLFGEKIVLRLLDSHALKFSIDDLGFEALQKTQFLKALKQPQGMIIVTGPTGSGKTITLYTALDLLNTTAVNIATAEDPVEMHVDGFNQVQINAKIGLNFATALRSFLRQDPDIIMLGEIRDLETAEIALKAAQTGHKVLSTLHTNSTTETISCLIAMGISNFNLANSINIIIAQRLVRKLCPHCKQVQNISKEALLAFGFENSELEPLPQIFEAKGCEYRYEGYKGRIGIYEIMPISLALTNLIHAGANSLELERVAKEEGMINLRRAGINKILNGISSMQEISRVS